MPNGDRRPSLDEVLVAFQKSLARTWTQTQEVSRSERSIREGHSPLFAVEGLDVELHVGFEMDAPLKKRKPDVVRVIFDDQLQEHSVVRFRVDMKPLDPEQ